jgi:hypothetical protein
VGTENDNASFLSPSSPSCALDTQRYITGTAGAGAGDGSAPIVLSASGSRDSSEAAVPAGAGLVLMLVLGAGVRSSAAARALRLFFARDCFLRRRLMVSAYRWYT